MKPRFIFPILSALFAVACGDCGGDDPIIITLDAGEDDSGPSVFVDLGQPDLGTCDPARPDPPDADFFDANCDGIDGDIDNSVFVAGYGDDANPGTQALPKRTVGSAIDTAKNEGKGWVLLGDGLHDGGFALADGVGIAGGYGFGWDRASRYRTSIRGGNPAITGDGIVAETLLIGFDVEPTGTPGDGDTVVTIRLRNSPGVRLRKVKITGGVGGEGTRGAVGLEGSPGQDGKRGDDGREDSGFIGCDEDGEPVPGLGGTNVCAEADGGVGGSPGHENGSGEDGGVSPGGAAGGPKGSASSPGGNGANGDRGGNGEAGTGGAAGGSFVFGGVWVGNDGSDGTPGSPGIGGGGGGGGGGGSGGCDSWGGAGGGGGSGGCGGNGGKGGGHGGASVALLLIDSDIEIVECTILGGVGGSGGGGGDGGSGGPGGFGQPGGSREDDSGAGGRGGDGGVGGRGGQGGGGAGGPAYAIFTNVALARQPVNSEITPGTGGTGGLAASTAGRGAPGEGAALKVGP